MSTRSEHDQHQKTIKTDIRLAMPSDAEKIVEEFSKEYEKYYGKYVDEEELTGFINRMRSREENGERLEELVKTIEDGDNEFVGVSAIKFQGNRAELGSTIIAEDKRGKENKNEEGVYDELFKDRHHDIQEMVEDESDPVDLAYTQLLADKSAKTQHTADKHDYAVTGVYNKKFPVAYEGKGRVTVVDMLWADSKIENQQEEVYIPEDAGETVEAALENINSKRSDNLEDVSRKIEESDKSRHETSYRVESKAVDKPDDDPMNFAEVEIVPDKSGDYSWSDVLNEIDEAERQIENEEDDYWVGVSIGVNDPTSADSIQALQGLGFNPAGFNPGKLESDGENQDALELQYNPSGDTYVKEFVNEAVEFMDRSGPDYREAEENTGHSSSQALEV